MACHAGSLAWAAAGAHRDSCCFGEPPAPCPLGPLDSSSLPTYQHPGRWQRWLRHLGACYHPGDFGASGSGFRPLATAKKDSLI